MSQADDEGPVLGEDLGHGPRLSGEEYDRRIVLLHTGAPELPSREEDRKLRRAALDLAIDHRLGQDFPKERRDALWEVQQAVERRRLWLAAKYLLGRLFGRRRPPLKGANKLAGWMVDHFGEVLDAAELESFFDLRGSEPGVPFDERGHGSD